MFSVIEVNVGVIKIQEFTCPSCGNRHQWRPPQQSPYICSSCNKIMMDVTRLILEKRWRAAYHFGGEKAVICNTLV